MANGGKATNSVFAHPLPFNVIPHIDKFLEDKYTKEERKVRVYIHISISISISTHTHT